MPGRTKNKQPPNLGFWNESSTRTLESANSLHPKGLRASHAYSMPVGLAGGATRG